MIVAVQAAMACASLPQRPGLPRPHAAGRRLAMPSPAVLPWLLACLLLLAAPAAGAHEMTIAEMELHEVAAGEFLMQWTASGARPAGEVLRPLWPDGCVGEPGIVRCGSAGFSGTFAIEGLGNGYSAALVKIHWRDGTARAYTFTRAQPRLPMYGSADDRRGFAAIAAAYTVLGVQHILEGVDHLLFVIALLFLVGYGRRLLWTITAFTLAHSLTLASSALGLLVLRSPPVEATIALSIVLVAGEALHTRATLARRWPALVAFLFGLVHGLGFAGALREIGLPGDHLWVALLTFNVGVELGQLLAIAAAWLVYQTVRNRALAPFGRRAVLYGIGAIAAYWSIERTLAIFA
jgi:hydrogenase/urease accessory protein HupE